MYEKAKVYEQTATGNYNLNGNVWYVDRNRDEVDRGTSQISSPFFPISRSDPNLGPVSWVGSFPWMKAVGAADGLPMEGSWKIRFGDD